MRYYLKLNVVGPCIDNKAEKSKFSRGRPFVYERFYAVKENMSFGCKRADRIA